MLISFPFETNLEKDNESATKFILKVPFTNNGCSEYMFSSKYSPTMHIIGKLSVNQISSPDLTVLFLLYKRIY